MRIESKYFHLSFTAQDIANQIRYSDLYCAAVKEAGQAPGRFLSVAAAEHLSGLPKNWTSPRAGDVNVEMVRDHFHARGNEAAAAIRFSP